MPDPDPTPASDPAPEQIAGKFNDQPAFEQGYRELAKKLEYPFPDDQAVIGEGGRHRTLGEATEVYSAMERIMGRMSTPDPTPDPEPAPAPTPPATPPQPPAPAAGADPAMQIAPPAVDSEAGVEAILQGAGLTQDQVVEQWNQGNQLTDDMYARIAGVNAAFSKTVVDQFITGLQAQTQIAAEAQAAARSAAARMVAGDSASAEDADTQLTNLLESAKQFLSPAEVPEINRLLGNTNTYGIAIRDLMTRHAAHLQATNATPPVEGGRTPAQTGGGITSTEEYATVRDAAARGDRAAQQRLKAHMDAGGRNPFI